MQCRTAPAGHSIIGGAESTPDRSQAPATGTTFLGPLTALWGESLQPAVLARMFAGAPSRIRVPTVDDRDAWAAVPEDTRTGLLAAATADLGRPWPVPLASQFSRYFRDGTRTAFEDTARALRERTARAVIAACLTAPAGPEHWQLSPDQRDENPSGEGVFWADQTADGLMLLCEMSTWCWAAHDRGISSRSDVLPDVTRPFVDLGAGEVAALLAWADHVLGPLWDVRHPGLRRRIRREVEVRVFHPFQSIRDWHWLGLDGDAHNWSPWIHSNILAAALLLIDDSSELTTMIALIIDGLDRYVAVLPADGGCDEGYSYWWHGAGKLGEALEMLRWCSSGGLAAHDVPVLEELARFPHRMHLGGDWYVNVADGPARPSRHHPWHMLHRWGRWIGDDKVITHAASYRRRRAPVVDVEPGLGQAMIGLFDIAWRSAEPGRAPLVRQSWLPDTQVLVAREVEGDHGGLAVSVKAGHNGERHNHNDVGSYLVAVDGRPLLVDVGQPTYTAQTFGPNRYEIWCLQSAWHNVPQFDDQPGAGEQQPGSVFSARSVSAELTTDFARLQADIAGAYPTDLGLRGWRRTVTLDRPDRLLTIEEDWRCEAEIGMSLTHVVGGDVEASEPGLVHLRAPGQKGGLRLSWDPARAEMSTEPMELTDPMLIANWGDHVTRLRLRLIDPGMAGRFVLRIRPLSMVIR